MKLCDLVESVNDKGIFKAVFLGGLPGSGKSTVIQRITDGAVSPRVVNTDRGYEFLMTKAGIPHEQASEKAIWQLLGPATKSITTEMLVHYLNGMLPLFVDGTSSSPNAVLKRTGLIESIGYDTAMIWVDTSIETALARMRGRERKVSEEFIEKLGQTMETIKRTLASRFGSNFIVVNNEGANFDRAEKEVFNWAQRFFSSSVQNSIGQSAIVQLREEGEAYLVPTIYEREYLERLVSIWYMR